jgi:hypothetical protein
MQRLLDKVNKPAVVLIALVVLISVDGFAYFYPNRNFERGPIVEEERNLPRAEGASAATPKKDAAPEVGRGGAVGGDRDEASPVREAGPHPPQPAPASSKASDEVGLPVGTSAVSPTVPAAPQGTAPPSTATPTATASSTAAATATPTATASATAAATAPPATAPPATATDAPTLEMSIEEGQATPDPSQIDSPQLPATPTPQDVSPRP